MLFTIASTEPLPWSLTRVVHITLFCVELGIVDAIDHERQLGEIKCHVRVPSTDGVREFSRQIVRRSDSISRPSLKYSEVCRKKLSECSF